MTAIPTPSRRESPVIAYTPKAWHCDHRLAIGGILLSSLITIVLGFIGPSVVTVTLGPRQGSLLPPWYLPVDVENPPNEWTVVIAVWVLLAIGGLSIAIALRALAAGWRPRPRRLIMMGVSLSTATALVPPLTSADVLMYVGYGRLQRIGLNPYEITPADITRGQFDPVMKWTEPPWTDTPSVYGPINAWLQLASNALGGENMHDIVFWMQAFHLLGFLGACAATVWIARGDRDRLNRAVLLTVLNPLMIWAIIATAHNEAISVVFAVGGMMLMRRSGFGAGIGIGLAGCAKLSIGLWGLAMVWAYRKQPKKLALLCLGAAIPMGLAYGWWQPKAFVSVLRNGSYVSAGSWAQPVNQFLSQILNDDATAKVVVGVSSYALMIVVAWMLSTVLPWSAVPGLAAGVDPRTDPMTVAVRTALILSTAWLFTAMYTLSWYDFIAFIPLGVLAPSLLDRLFLWRNTFLSLAFVPGRVVEISPQLDVTVTRVREIVSPIVQGLVLVALFAWFFRHRREARQPGPRSLDSAVPVETQEDRAEAADTGPVPDRAND
ncbi:MAG: polyprenol phosphomannose-dependent alpha 1,6 mannosyltransferase MptB [Propionibacteriales bacterium]|nr:polyprenol phosphomannose-dependent alpha 1,6 mannosyltransferase MptB [Propionibacteriales bacterium]